MHNICSWTFQVSAGDVGAERNVRAGASLISRPAWRNVRECILCICIFLLYFRFRTVTNWKNWNNLEQYYPKTLTAIASISRHIVYTSKIPCCALIPIRYIYTFFWCTSSCYISSTIVCYYILSISTIFTIW